MGRPVARWNVWGKWLSGIVVLCFFLPFFGISCDGVDVVHFSGVDMAAGLAPGGMLMDAADESASRPGHHDGGITVDKKVSEVPVEPLAIVALASAVIVFGASWSRKRGARAAALAFCFVSLGGLGGLYVKMTGKLDDLIAEENKPGKGGVMQKDVKITSGARFGLYVDGFGLLGLAALAGTAVRQREDDPIPPATALPPGGFPPPAA